MAVHDQPGDLVGVVRNDLLGEEGVQRQVGQHPGCGRPLPVVFGCAPGQLVTGTQRGGLGHHLHEPVEGVVHPRNLLPVLHLSSSSASASIANSSSGELATRRWRLYTAKYTMNAANTTRHRPAATGLTRKVAMTARIAMTSAMLVVTAPPGVRYGRGMLGSRTRSTMWLTIIST